MYKLQVGPVAKSSEGSVLSIKTVTMIRKCIVFSLLVTLCVAHYNPPRFIQVFGNFFLNDSFGRYGYIGTQQALRVSVPLKEALKETTVTVTFPKVRINFYLQIQHFNLIYIKKLFLIICRIRHRTMILS